MIMPNEMNSTSQIAFTIVTLTYLMVYELGNKKLRKIMIPLIVVLLINFLILAGIKIYFMGAD
jgi:hypothetical protein